MRGTVPTGVERPSGLISEISEPGKAPSVSASRAPIAICPLPGVIVLRSPAFTLPFRIGLARMSSTRLPRTSTPSTRPLALAISGCSISGIAAVTPGVALARSAIICQSFEAAVIALDDGVAVETDDLVEQFGAKAVHHRHDDDQRGDAERDGADAEPGDDEDEPLALAGQEVAPRDHPFVAVEDHAVSLASASSMVSSSFSPVRRFLSSTVPAASPRGPRISCHGRPMRSIEPSLTPPRSSRSS